MWGYYLLWRDTTVSYLGDTVSTILGDTSRRIPPSIPLHVYIGEGFKKDPSAFCEQGGMFFCFWTSQAKGEIEWGSLGN